MAAEPAKNCFVPSNTANKSCSDRSFAADFVRGSNQAWHHWRQIFQRTAGIKVGSSVHLS